MLLRFKDRPEDFIVSEILHSEPSGEGDVLYVLFEKKLVNTMDIIHIVCKETGLERKQLGIAGLKDKQGITRQRISIWKSALEQVGGIDSFIQVLSKHTTILERSWHDSPLQIGSNAGNAFTIRLRANQVIDNQTREAITKKLQELQVGGFPNCFGMQRFGKKLRNYHRAKDILYDPGHDTDSFEIRFKLQAYPSFHFNEYALARHTNTQVLLDGDIVVNSYGPKKLQAGVYHKGKVTLFDYERLKKAYKHSNWMYPAMRQKEITYSPDWIATGPMLGYNLIVPVEDSPARQAEWPLYERLGFWDHAVDVCKIYGIYGIRRPLWVIADGLTRKRLGNDLFLQFILPTGAYATVLLSWILSDIDPQGCREQGLIIPII